MKKLSSQTGGIKSWKFLYLISALIDTYAAKAAGRFDFDNLVTTLQQWGGDGALEVLLRHRVSTDMQKYNTLDRF